MYFAAECRVAAPTRSITTQLRQTTGILSISVTADPPVIPLETWRLGSFGGSALNSLIAGDN